MILTTLFAASAFSAAAMQPMARTTDTKPSLIACPITGEPVTKGMKVTEFNGVQFTYCCPGCDTQFVKDPQKALTQAVTSGKTVGVFLFDPVSFKRISADEAKGGSSDFQGVRYLFETASDKSAFDANPAKFGKLPEKEALYCPVSNKAVTSYGKASGYADYDGVRYYFCCPGCDGPFAKDPAKFAAIANGHLKVPAPLAAEKSDAVVDGGGKR